jgi:hypothetical protein
MRKRKVVEFRSSYYAPMWAAKGNWCLLPGAGTSCYAVWIGDSPRMGRRYLALRKRKIVETRHKILSWVKPRMGFMATDDYIWIAETNFTDEVFKPISKTFPRRKHDG